MRYLHKIGTVNGKIPRSHTSFHVPISMLHDIPTLSSMCMLLTHQFTFILLMHVQPSRVQIIGAYKACFEHTSKATMCKHKHYMLICFFSLSYFLGRFRNHKWKSCGRFTRLKHCCFRLFLCCTLSEQHTTLNKLQVKQKWCNFQLHFVAL